MMNRRAILAAIAASSLPLTARAGDASMSDTFRAFIQQVIIDGNMDDLDTLVSADVSIPAMDLAGINAFRAASIDGYEARASRFTDQEWEIVSIATEGDWAHALVHMDAHGTNGAATSQDVFYVGRFVDGQIAELRFG